LRLALVCCSFIRFPKYTDRDGESGLAFVVVVVVALFPSTTTCKSPNSRNADAEEEREHTTPDDESTLPWSCVILWSLGCQCVLSVALKETVK